MSSATPPLPADRKYTFFNHVDNTLMEHRNPTQKPRPRVSPTLGELLKRVEDAQSPAHQVLDVSYAGGSVPPSYPFVLNFNSLTYSVKAVQEDVVAVMLFSERRRF
jgi:hypothetical protein